VSDLEARAVFRTRIRVGARRADALVNGVPDFARQTVDAVEVVSGRVPAEGEALVDPAARRAGRWTGGTRVRLVDSAGRVSSLAVVGQGQSLEYTAEGDVRGAVVVYAPERSVEQLAGFRGPNAFAVHFRDRGSAAVETTLTELHARLDAVVGRNSFLGLPLVRPGDTWPGQDGVQKYDTFLLVSRETYTLRLYKKLKLVKTYPIAVGMAGLDTPAGLYDIDDNQVDPWWHVPNSAWAGDLAGRVIPPGPDDPIKARWMGFYDGAGIHGTDEDWSIGSAASHGCIRMHIWDVEDLYDRVPLHTPIYVG
jgi:hypothetical protein